MHDFLSPDRIVMGAIDDRTAGVLEDLYRPFHGVVKLRTNPRTAETIKYAANSLLATMISFSNEIANLCAAIGDVDVVDVMRGVHLDKRFSPLLSDGHAGSCESLTRVPAVDADERSSHERTSVRQQKHHGPADLVGRS